MRSHPTREALLDAGVALGDEHGLTQVAVDHIVREAGVAKGTFYVHFADRGSFLVAIHQRFHDQLEAAVRTATTGMAPGHDRLVAGATAYLDACLDQRGVKSVLLEARSDPAVAVEVARRNRMAAEGAAADLAALGMRSPEAAARLFVALVAEAALVELEVGHHDPDTRQAVADFATPRAQTARK
jgi:AcrR family transcriptional regulator